MDAYLRIVQDIAKGFEFFELTKVPRGENICADALAALGSKLHDQVKRTIPIHRIERPSIDQEGGTVASVTEATPPIDDSPATTDDDQTTDWRLEFINFLAHGTLPADKWEARRLKRRSVHYVVTEGELHRWTATKVLLKFIHGEQTRLVMAETHEGAADCDSYVRHCDKCQRHACTIHSPTELLRTMTAPYPFMRWGMNIIGPLPTSRQKRFILVLTDYFTKWVEAEAYANVTDKEWRIRLNTSTPRYPQCNGQGESTNKTVIDGLKKRLDLKKGCWADELDGVLWSHRTTPRGATQATPFSLAYGVEAMAPAEVNVTSLRRSKMPLHDEINRDMLLDALDNIEERRDQALLRIQNYQNQIESYYNKKVRSRPLELGDLVLRKVFENTKEWKAGKLGANWEGPYKITQVIRPRVFRLETSRGDAVPRAWNSMHLRRFYS
ncbi:uncharacterized protein LOC130502257 [Raphanus sativus]|uniref:Uncharacterized protein LOC130502257 n=1 Tax=Raphanus sativus TaxID=3726 RepID=A0A9W3CNE7_RAPSA|nr:uncharacterized protein LOC130502257 [Raphanus sativus]